MSKISPLIKGWAILGLVLVAVITKAPPASLQSQAPEATGSPTTEPTSSPTEEPTPAPTDTPAPTPTPTFTCCEQKIKVTQVKAVPHNTQQTATGLQITIDYQLDLKWDCDLVRNQDCLAYYDITLESSTWQEFKDGKWVDVAAGAVRESIISDPSDKLKVACDGKKGHAGTWSYAYFVELTTKNKVRNTGLVFDWDVPTNKGRSYHAEYTVEGVSGTTGTKPPSVKGPHPKQK